MKTLLVLLFVLCFQREGKFCLFVKLEPVSNSYSWRSLNTSFPLYSFGWEMGSRTAFSLSLSLKLEDSHLIFFGSTV